MKTKINLFILAWSLAFLSSCSDDYVSTSNVSDLTYFAVIDLEGESTVYVDCGSSANVPGATATENGQEIPLNTTVEGVWNDNATIDFNKPDKYVFNYSATNADGFDSFAERTIYVFCTGDLVNDISGLYKSTVTRNGVLTAQYTGLEYVLINKTGPNTYSLSDAIGGYYDFGRGYGDRYRAKGITITANDIATNNFSFNGPIGVGAFGGELTMVSMSVDAAKKTINFTSSWDAGYNFEVLLEQI